ncbi:MAG: 4-hydroxybenzoate octaprenyltransferase [Halofilum sp. (in: g-proteobacteria)]
MSPRQQLAAFAAHPRTQWLRARLWQYALLTRVDRPVGTYLLLWPALWALWIAAGGVPDGYVLLVIVAGVFLTRAAGCAINDFADRGIDAHVARTSGRPLATGAIRAWEALAVAAVLMLVAFALVLTLNWLTIYLSFVALGLAALYPFTKRMTHLPQIFLGLAFSWAVPMAFAAETGEVPPVAWLVFTVNVIWTVAYDSLYAMADKPEDERLGVKSIAILFGDWDRHMVALLQAMSAVGFGLIGARIEASGWYYAAVGIAVALFGYQQFLAHHRQPALCLRAFLNNAWVGLIVFVGLVLHYAWA